MQIMKLEENFFDVLKNKDRLLVLYGIGQVAQKLYPYLPPVSYAVDQKADGEITFHNLSVKQPEELKKINKPLAILICVQDVEVSLEIKNKIQQMDLDALVFEYCNNSGFNVFYPVNYVSTSKEIRNVRLVCQDSGWILSKFAGRMKEQLQMRGIRAEISDVVDPEADINHHIAFHLYEPVKDYADTLMITHVDSLNKLNLLKHQLQVARMGICMSRESMNNLVSWGIPREKLCYINPAQDGVIKPKKFVLGITHRSHEAFDRRKRINALLDICSALDPAYFCFKIMGFGWDHVVKSMQDKGFEVEYYPEFDYDIYTNLIPSLDYYLFWGFDEGSMGYLDALAAGVETIVTPQGYHLDIKNGITYPCRIVDDFIEILLEIQNKRKRRVESVKKWTWSNYVDKHLEVWKYILGCDKGIYDNKHLYEDSIFSVLGINA
ncbi:MAG: hypothetical protein K2K90_13240 [Lachnospiraceae bacterium]|nr:hypothetical protein [Lachnospiraceae bacterium]